MLKQEFLKTARVCTIPSNEELTRAHLHSRKMSQAGCQNHFCFVFSRNHVQLWSLIYFFLYLREARNKELIVIPASGPGSFL